jgi:hypothetical protein
MSCRTKSKSVWLADGKPTDERLVAVAEVDGAPHRRSVDRLRRPGAVGQVGDELLGVGAVAMYRHPRGALRVLHGVCLSGRKVCQPTTNSATREARN